MPHVTMIAAAMRRAAKPSLNRTAPITVPKMTLLSRSADNRAPAAGSGRRRGRPGNRPPIGSRREARSSRSRGKMDRSRNGAVLQRRRAARYRSRSQAKPESPARLRWRGRRAPQKRIGSDSDPGREGKREGFPITTLANHEHQDARGRQGDCRDLEQAQTFADRKKGDQRQQDRGGAARNRIDKADIADLVLLEQQAVVGEYRDRRAAKPHPSGRNRPGHKRQHGEAIGQSHEPDRRHHQQAVARALDQPIPGRMGHSRQQHQSVQ